MLQVAALCFDRQPRRRPRERSFLPARQRIQKMIQQLTEAEIMSCGAAELAERCNGSLRHFHWLFQEQIGASFRAKQAELRLRQGQQSPNWSGGRRSDY